MNLLRAALLYLHRSRKPQAAAKLLDAVIRLRPRSVMALQERFGIALALGDDKAAIRACEGLLAVDPDDVNEMRNLAILRLRVGNVAGATPLFARLEAQDHAVPIEMRACRMSLMDAERAAQGIPYVATLDDVLVDTDYWSVVHGDRVYCRETHDRTLTNAQFVNGRVSPDGQLIIVALTAPVLTVEAPCVLLGGDDNYSHWLYRNVLKLALLEDIPEARNLPLLINADLRGYQRQYLDLLGIPESRLIRVPRGAFVRCRRLFVPTVLRNHPQMRIGIDWLRSKLDGLIGQTRDATDRVYLSRCDTEVRRLINETELVSALQALGFRTIVPGRMAVREQVAVFARANVIVAAHGAGLTNLIFSPPGALVIEIVSTKLAHMEDFRYIARVRGHRIRTIVADDYGPTPDSHDGRVLNWNFRVNVDAVLAALRDELEHPAAGATIAS